MKYIDYTVTVPVGDLYGAVKLDDRTIRRGDIVAFDDPDIDDRDIERGIHTRLYIGTITHVLKPDRGDEPELMSTLPIGSIRASDANVSGRNSTIPPESGQQKFVEQFINSDYSKYMVCEWGDPMNRRGE